MLYMKSAMLSVTYYVFPRYWLLYMTPAMLSVTYNVFPRYWLCYPWSQLCYQWLRIPQILTMLSMKPAMLSVTYYVFPRYLLCYPWSQLCYQWLTTYSQNNDYVIHEASYVISDLLPIPQVLTMLSMKPAMLSMTFHLFLRYWLCYPWSQLCYQRLTMYSPDSDYVIHEASYVISE